MKEIRVFIPEEHFTILEFNQENLPGIAVVNTALRDFDAKEVFTYHLSLRLFFKDLIENGMPSQAEREIVDSYGDELDNLIKGQSGEKPNAVFLGRVTWNGTRELLWRIHDPETTNELLQDIITKNEQLREFDYKMDPDPDWNMTQWYLTKHDAKKEDSTVQTNEKKGLIKSLRNMFKK